MKKSNKLNIFISIIIALVGAVILSLIMSRYLDKAMTDRQRAASEEKLVHVSAMLDEMNATKAAEESAFDELNISKADTVAYMAQNVKDFAMTNEHMEELRKTIDVYNLLIVDNTGEIVCSALESPRDYSINRFNQLRDVWSNDGSAVPFTISMDDISLRYYGAKIDDEHMVIIVRNTEVLEQKLASLASLSATLDDVRVGQEGFVFAVSPLDYTFLYYPDEAYIGKTQLPAVLMPPCLKMV